MKRLIHILTYGGLILLLTACAYKTPRYAATISITANTALPLQSFHRLDVEGPVHVYIKHNSPSSQMVIQGDAVLVGYMQAYIKDDTLWIKPKPHKGALPSGDVTLILSAPEITRINIHSPHYQRQNTLAFNGAPAQQSVITMNNGNINVANLYGEKVTFNVSGNSRLQGNCISTHHTLINATQNAKVWLKCLNVMRLSVNAENKSNVTLQGQAGKLEARVAGASMLHASRLSSDLVSLKTEGKSDVSLYDMDAGQFYGMAGGNSHLLITGNSHQLTLAEEDSGRVTIRGVAQRLNATLSGLSHLNAMCLRSRTIFVKTTDHADARVRNFHGLSAVAGKQSDIYYYQDPLMVAEYLRLSGSVMRMNGIASARC